MSKWIRVEDELPPENNRGIWDNKRYLCYLNNECGIMINTWMNNRWNSFPAGGTDVTHWMELPDDPT